MAGHVHCHCELRNIPDKGISAKNEQVAQLWQRDRAKLDTFAINSQHYSQNHAQNWIFNTKKPRSRFSSKECQFYS